MSLPIQPRNPNILPYVHGLTAAYRAGIWLPDQDYALAQDPNVWEKVRRDPIAYQAIEGRLHKIAGKDWIVAPASKDAADQKAAALCERMVAGIDCFAAERKNLAKAVFKGAAYAWIEGERRVVETDGKALSWWTPLRLRDVDKRRVRHVPESIPKGDGTVEYRVHIELWSVGAARWNRVDEATWQNFVRLVYDDEESQFGQGRGLLNAIYFFHWAKGVVLREGLQGLERWAQGIITAKIDGLREASSGKENASQIQSWIDALEAQRARHSLVYDAKDEFQVHESTGTGHQMVISMLAYLDEAITRAASGSLLPSGGGSSEGSFKRAEVEDDQSESLVQFDRALLDEAITRDLIGQWWRLNTPQRFAAGIGTARIPKLLSNTLKREDPEKSARIAASALQAKIPLRKDEVYRKLGYTQPADGDEVFEGGGSPFGAPAGPSGELPSTGNPMLDAARRRIAENQPDPAARPAA